MTAVVRRDPVPFRFDVRDAWGANGKLIARSYRTELEGVFARAGARVGPDLTGRLVSTVRDLPPLEWAGGEPGLACEHAEPNLLLRSQEFDHATWAKSAVSGGTAPAVTANAATAPDGSATADSVVFVAPVSGDQSSLTQASVTTTSGVRYCGSLYLRAATAADVGKILLLRHVGGSAYTAITLTADWQRAVAVEPAIGTSSSFEIALRPALGSSSGTVTVLLWGADLKYGAGLTGYVRSDGTSGTRVADSCYFPFRLPPQECTVYLRGVERIAVNGTLPNTTVLWSVTDAAGNDAKMYVRRPGSATGYRFVHEPVTATETASVGTAATIGDVVELRAVLSALGAPQLGVAINGGAEEISAVGSAQALAAAWSAERFYLNSFGSSNVGAFVARQVVVEVGTKSMAEMRARAGVG